MDVDVDRDRPTTLVVGAGRGLGRAIAARIARDGGTVVTVSRTAPATPLDAGPATAHTELADAADPAVPSVLLERHDPDAVVLVAGSTPDMRPLQDHSWESFSTHWHNEVQVAFRWLTEILRRPAHPGLRVIVISSGAALAGSPLSGGYAGAKATQRFVAAYAADEARRAGRHIVVTTVFPQYAPETAVGAAGVTAYAAQAGLSVDDFVAALPFPVLTPPIAADAVRDLLRREPADVLPEYLLNGAGLHPLGAGRAAS